MLAQIQQLRACPGQNQLSNEIGLRNDPLAVAMLLVQRIHHGPIALVQFDLFGEGGPVLARLRTRHW